jgi:hypothetical protein
MSTKTIFRYVTPCSIRDLLPLFSGSDNVLSVAVFVGILRVQICALALMFEGHLKADLETLVRV